MELQAITGLLHIVGGVTQEQSPKPGLVAQSAPSTAVRGRQRDMLFVNLTLSGQHEESGALAQDLLDTITSLFYNTTGGVTAALRKAIIETNKRLLAYNIKGDSPVREGAVTCVALRGEELFMAQAGEAYALFGHNFGIEKLQLSQAERVVPLGRSAGINIRLFHYWLQPGDMLLVGEPRLAHITLADMETVLIDTDVATGLEELTTLIGTDSARVILIEFTDEAPGYVPDAIRPVSTSPTGRRLPPPTEPPRRQAAHRQATGTQPVWVPSGSKFDVEVVETSTRRATSGAARGLARFTGWLADLMAKLQPARRQGEPETNWAVPAAIAVIIPLLVAAIVAGVFVQRGRAVRYGEIKRAINENLVLAQQAGEDSEAANQYYMSALEFVAEGEQIRPGDTELDKLRREAIAGLDSTAGVARLIGHLIHRFDPATTLTSISLGDELKTNIYVLDSAANLVYRVRMDETLQILDETDPDIILFGNQVIGSHIVGHLVDLFWRAGGSQVSRDGLATLDAQGALLSYYPNFADTRAANLGLASDWSLPKAITTFNERLYILDPAAQMIWRYFAEGDGFTLSEDQRFVEFFDETNLDQVVDMAIYSEDGSVILLYQDGRLRRYANGRLLWSETELQNNGLETPLISPTAVKIVGRGLNQSIFVADPGSERIVQLSMGGTFLAQYKASDELGHELFNSVSDFSIAESPFRIYVTHGDSLYVATQD